MLIQTQQSQRKQKKLAAELDDLKLSDKRESSESKGEEGAAEDQTRAQEEKESVIKEEVVSPKVDTTEEQQVKIATSADEIEKPVAGGGDERLNKEPNGDGEERIIEENRDEIEVEQAAEGEAADDDREEGDDNEEEIPIDPRTYCKLGHFHLLLEDYAKGNSNYNLVDIKSGQTLD